MEQEPEFVSLAQQFFYYFARLLSVAAPDYAEKYTALSEQLKDLVTDSAITIFSDPKTIDLINSGDENAMIHYAEEKLQIKVPQLIRDVFSSSAKIPDAKRYALFLCQICQA